MNESGPGLPYSPAVRAMADALLSLRVIILMTNPSIPFYMPLLTKNTFASYFKSFFFCLQNFTHSQICKRVFFFLGVILLP